MGVYTGQESSPALDSINLPGGQDSSDKGLRTVRDVAPFSLEKTYKVGWYMDGRYLFAGVTPFP